MRLRISGSLREGPEGATVSAVIESTVDQLMWFTFAIIAVALIVAAVAMWYERHAAQAAAEAAGEEVEKRSVREWLQDNVRAISYAGIAVIGFVVLWNVGGPDITLLATATVGIWLIAMNLLAKQPEDDDATPSATAASG